MYFRSDGYMVKKLAIYGQLGRMTQAMFWCAVFALLFSKATSISLTYDDPLITAMDCFPNDSCSEKLIQNAPRLVRLLEDFKTRSCFCDEKCIDFGDCCADSPHLKDAPQPVEGNGQVCEVLKNYGGIYMVKKCPLEWADPGIREQCEDFKPGTVPSPLAQLPVSDIEDGTTYRNFYCAVCNGHNNPRQVRLWQSRVQFISSRSRRRNPSEVIRNLTKEFLLENIHYNYTVNHWGVTVNSMFVRCDIDPFMPDNLEHKVRRCREAKSDCAPDWSDDEIREKCKLYSGTVALFGDLQYSFKNIHCGVCNGFSPENMTCVTKGPPINSRQNNLNTFNIGAFAMLLDFNSNDGQHVGIVNRCAEDQVYDPFFKECKNVVCGYENLVYENGRCVNKDVETTTVSTDIDGAQSGDVRIQMFNNVSRVDNGSISSNTSDNATKSILDRTFIECPKWNVHKNNVLTLMNGSIYIVTYEKLFDPGQFDFTPGSHVLICAQRSSPGEIKFSLEMTIASLIGLGISLICLTFHFIIFLIVPDLQNLSGKNLASLVLALFVAYLSFILGMFGKPGSVSCFVISAVTYYSFLAVFVWMNVISADVWQTLRMATTELRVSGGRQLRKYLLYSLYAWGFPAVCVTIALLLDYSIISAPADYQPAFGTRNCWFGNRFALAVLFGGPTGVLLALNIIFFVLSTSIIVWSTRSSSKFDSPSGSSKRSYKLYLRLAVICGLTWIWGFLAGFFNLEPLWYVFIFFNTLMGLFIFLTFTCTKKVRTSLKNRIKCLSRKTKKAELFNISASSGSNLNSNDTRKSTLIPTDSGDSNSSEKFDGMYNPLSAYKTSSPTLY